MFKCTCSKSDHVPSRYRLRDLWIFPLWWLIRPWRCTSCGERFYRGRWARRHVDEVIDPGTPSAPSSARLVANSDGKRVIFD